MKTLIWQFIFEKYKSYLEPQRKGTPKGHTIGFSKEKYFASLQMITALKQKDIAKGLVSYGLLRVWNTEGAFKKAIIDHCFEFSKYLMFYLRQKTDENIKYYDDLLQQPIKKISQLSPCLPFDFEPFKDFKFYSPSLQFIIFSNLDSIAEEALKKEDHSFLMTLMLVSTFFHREIGIKSSPENIEARKKLQQRLLQSMINDIKKILLKKTIIKRDRKTAMVFLNSLEGAFV